MCVGQAAHLLRAPPRSESTGVPHCWDVFLVGFSGWPGEHLPLPQSLLHSKPLLSGQTCRASEPVLSSDPATSDFLGPSSFSPHHH